MNEILRDAWNPIGTDVPADEYSGYARTVGRLLHEGGRAPAIAAFLAEARKNMGLDADPDHDRLIAERLAEMYPG